MRQREIPRKPAGAQRRASSTRAIRRRWWNKLPRCLSFLRVKRPRRYAETCRDAPLPSGVRAGATTTLAGSSFTRKSPLLEIEG